MSSDKNEFEGVWHGWAQRLLREQPFSWTSSPTGHHKAINQLQTRGYFEWIGKHAVANGGTVARKNVWEEYARADLEPHDKTLEDITKLGLFENTQKRVKKAISDGMKTLVFFGLFVANKDHEYTITDKGRRLLFDLDPTAVGPAALPPTLSIAAE